LSIYRNTDLEFVILHGFIGYWKKYIQMMTGMGKVHEINYNFIRINKILNELRVTVLN